MEKQKSQYSLMSLLNFESLWLKLNKYEFCMFQSSNAALLRILAVYNQWMNTVHLCQ